MTRLAGVTIHIDGIVQGVGFRPFVYGLAKRLDLTGWVRNTSAGVDIEIDGPPQHLETFIAALRAEAPPLARIHAIEISSRPPAHFSSFEIIHSQSITDAFQPISPDVCTCEDCLKEMADPRDRRYRYSFINCTNCGPRFTIITDIPYDRPNTTMAGFKLCPDCQQEYEDPLDRRFHAQPIACPVCGPSLWLEQRNGAKWTRGPKGDQALKQTQELLKQGKILAIKGLGGFHLACDAENEAAVAELRRRKLRVDKPFALMMPDLATIELFCQLSSAEREALTALARPIVILQRRQPSSIAWQVAPGQDTLGVMLPYTPLHALLFLPDHSASGYPAVPRALVMTSGNQSEEPIAFELEEARRRLGSLADAFLMHDRPIRTRCDDSVVRLFQPGFSDPVILPLRRSRGYAPYPVQLPRPSPPILAVGAELKNTFCLSREKYALLSHHIGDLENVETLVSFEDGIRHFEHIFRFKPCLIAHDLHPDYLSTRYALERARQEELPTLGVQHHHAHIAACMTEHSLSGEQPVIGLAFDGTGFGSDGAIWGGEFLIADYRGFQRPYHLGYVPLLGGEIAIREPWRMALSWCAEAGIPWADDLPPIRFVHAELDAPEKRLEALHHQYTSRLNSPLTSSMGRLFDAVAALIGVKQKVNYEAQAAIELEALVDPNETGWYPFVSELGQYTENTTSPLSPASLLTAALEDLRLGRSPGVISARFHRSVARIVNQVCCQIRQDIGINTVALSGGVWQNRILLQMTLQLLHADQFEVLWHRQVPPNDGGIALGQAAIAAQWLVDQTGE